MAASHSPSPCIFCQIARSATSTRLLHQVPPLSLSLNFASGELENSNFSFRVLVLQDDKVVAFQDIKPAAFRHYLVIPVEHIPTVKNLQRRPEDYSLVSHMLDVGKMLLQRDAPQSKEHRFGFHQPPFNSVDHLHLHCLGLPFTPSLFSLEKRNTCFSYRLWKCLCSWKAIKYKSFGPFGFIEAEKLLEKIKPEQPCNL
ncbi:hypothetical protein Cgig2_019926 [Carnegiea gigantea]|uniref:HIT domain-containing protein n=1 Tax=Carnegiea gigantea TaxID=171969 RepID=A0A9Q1KJ86_9CARY|nr:hypothetical protein Cgig2_019926 [Carnegiea gigantea]